MLECDPSGWTMTAVPRTSNGRVPACAKSRPASGSGEQRTRSGSRARSGIGWSRPTPSTPGRASCSSTRSTFPRDSGSARARSCSRVRGTVATRRSSACRSTSRRPTPDPDPVRGEVFRGGDTLPFGVRAFEGFEPNDLVLDVGSRRAVVVGDTDRPRQRAPGASRVARAGYRRRGSDPPLAPAARPARRRRAPDARRSCRSRSARARAVRLTA